MLGSGNPVYEDWMRATESVFLFSGNALFLVCESLEDIMTDLINLASKMLSKTMFCCSELDLRRTRISKF
jgi:hypothetical protein